MRTPKETPNRCPFPRRLFFFFFFFSFSPWELIITIIEGVLRSS